MRNNDIEVFVVTYDRPDFLERQLTSLCAQTVKPRSVVVLDDGPNPRTKDVCLRFSSKGVIYARSEQLGLWGNIHEAQLRATAPYTAIFHDDDQIHPRYIEFATKVLSAHPEVTLLGCNTFTEAPTATIPFSNDVDGMGYLMNQREFASFWFNDNFGNFPFFIYRTENLKKIDVLTYLDYNGPYGKHGDSAFVPLSMGHEGFAAMLRSRFANYGTHAAQAVSDNKLMPDARCWARVEAVFHELLGDDVRTFPGFSYAFRNFKRIRAGYRRRGFHDYSFREYLGFAYEFGAISPYMKRFRWLCNHYTEKVLLEFGRYRVRRSLLDLTR